MISDEEVRVLLLMQKQERGKKAGKVR